MTDENNNFKGENWVSISEAAKYLRVSKDTLRRWEKQKILKSYRSPTNHRYYKKDELDYVFSQKPTISYEKALKEDKGSPQVATQTSDRQSMVVIALLTTYIILMVVLAWLLMQNLNL